MKTKGVRLYGKSDIRLEDFELPNPKDDEIVARVISDSVCMSTYKEVVQGADHKRVPDDVYEHPIIIGHEFSGELVHVGEKWKHAYNVGERFAIQPNINYLGKGYAPGYSFPYFGGASQFIVIPNAVMEGGFLLNYTGDAFYKASLAEPISCIISGFRSLYHTIEDKHEFRMGPRPNGKMAILAGAGPMGLGAIDYALNSDNAPELLVVTDIDDSRLERARQIFNSENCLVRNTKLIFINTMQNHSQEILLDLTDNTGYDDVIVFAPVRSVVEMADNLLGTDGCMNFFAGPTDTGFRAEINFYNVHYMSKHISGSSGGNTEDMEIAIDMINKGKLNPSVMVSHVGGIDSIASTTANLPKIPGGKKLMYLGINLELTELSDFRSKSTQNPIFGKIADIIDKNNGLWSEEAETNLLNALSGKL